MSIYTVKQSKVIALILIIILGLFLLFSLRILFTAILASVVIYVLFKPMFIYFSEKKKLNKSLSVIIVFIISIVIIIIPFSVFIWMLTNKILYYKDNPESINKVITSVEDFVGQTFDQSTVQDAVNQVSTVAIGIFTSFVNSTLDLILTIGMMYFFLYFMFKKYKVFETTLTKYIPFRGKNSEHFATELKNMTHANIIGQGIIAFAQALFMYIGFLLFNIDDPLFWSILCFFLSFLPIIGSAGVFVPVGVVEIATGNVANGIWLMVYGFVVVANVDNVLRMWVNKWLGDIHPLITITGIVIGIPVFGILGLVFGPFLISVFLLLVRLYEAAYLDYTPEKERTIDPKEIRDEVKD
ncbi:MAG: AI-2E family transporter [Ignavibacteriaceae bacterium]